MLQGISRLHNLFINVLWSMKSKRCSSYPTKHERKIHKEPCNRFPFIPRFVSGKSQGKRPCRSLHYEALHVPETTDSYYFTPHCFLDIGKSRWSM